MGCWLGAGFGVAGVGFGDGAGIGGGLRLGGLLGRAEAQRRALMETLRDQGYSYADIAGATGVSKGRVSQIVNA